jgi:hypothetical protein
MRTKMKKTAAIFTVLSLAACSSSPPPVQNFAPLDYSYLRPITFKVANLTVVNEYTPGSDEAQLNANNPAPPGPTLVAMLNQRMQPSGEPGTANITVQVASITESGGNLNGQMTVDINLTSADGRSTGFAEASVSATAPQPDSDADTPAALYQMTKNLMDRINVQLPYSIVHNIPSWVAWTQPVGAPVSAAGGLAPGAIQAAPLGAPGSTAAPVVPGSAPVVPSGAPVPMASPAIPALNPAVPNYLPGAGPTALTPPQ